MSRFGTVLATAVAMIGAAGCESDRSAMNEFFPQGERAPHVFAAAHAHAGARNDATLLPHHFDGGELNSLGREKLDLIAADHDDRATATSMPTIYLNFGEGDGMDARRGAVVLYLRDKGIEENSLRFVSGPNPNATSPAATHLKGLSRLESSSGSGAGDADATGYLPEPMTGRGGGGGGK